MKYTNMTTATANETSMRRWSEVDPSSDTEPIPLPFNQSVGPQLPAMPSQTPADFFHLIFTNELLDVLVTETNRYQISAHTYLYMYI